MRILIYDDDLNACVILRELLHKESFTQNNEILIATCLQQAELHIKKGIDILFQDIELKNNENGIKFAKDMKSANPDLYVVFITAHIKYCEEIFEASPVGFILKPFTEEKVQRVLHILQRSMIKNDYLSISNSKDNIIRIPLNEVAYIENQYRKIYVYGLHQVIIHTVSGIKLSEIAKQLPNYFIRCHHSFCVNLNMVRRIQRYYFTLTCGNSVPVSQKQFGYARESFINFMGDKL